MIISEKYRHIIAKNGPLDHISELKMINGFKDNPEIYELFEKYFTTVSGGLVNINTASAEVIGLLPGMEPYLAGEIVNYRSSEFGPFRDLGQLNTPELGAPPELISDIRRYLSTKSATFDVEVTAQIGKDPPRKYRALLRRVTERDIRILLFPQRVGVDFSQQLYEYAKQTQSSSVRRSCNRRSGHGQHRPSPHHRQRPNAPAKPLPKRS